MGGSRFLAEPEKQRSFFLLILFHLLQLLSPSGSSAAAQAFWQIELYQPWGAHHAWSRVNSDAAHMVARKYLFAFP